MAPEALGSPGTLEDTSQLSKSERKRLRKEQRRQVETTAATANSSQPPQQSSPIAALTADSPTRSEGEEKEKKNKKDKKRKRSLSEVDVPTASPAIAGTKKDVISSKSSTTKLAAPHPQTNGGSDGGGGESSQPAHKKKKKKHSNDRNSEKRYREEQAAVVLPFPTPAASRPAGSDKMDVDGEKDDDDARERKRRKKEKKALKKEQKRVAALQAQPQAARAESSTSTSTSKTKSGEPISSTSSSKVDVVAKDRKARKAAKKEFERLAAEKKAVEEVEAKRVEEEKHKAEEKKQKAEEKKQKVEGKKGAVEVTVEVPSRKSEAKMKNPSAAKSRTAASTVASTSKQPLDRESDDDDEDIDDLIRSLMVAAPKPKPKANEKASPRTKKTSEGKSQAKVKGKKRATSDDDDDQRGSNAKLKAGGRRDRIQRIGDGDPLVLLRTKWLSPPQLKALAESNPGFWYNSGRFTRSEDDQIYKAVLTYRNQHGLTADEMATVITTPRTRNHPDERINTLLARHEGFWPDLAAVLVRRPLLSLYNHVRRMYHPLARSGPWTDEEDDLLRAAYREHGANWQLIAEDVGRAAFDCQDRYQKQLALNGRRLKGAWDPEEIERLRQSVSKHGKRQWSIVSGAVGTRSPAQCRTKWYNDLQRRDAANASDEGKALLKHRSNLVHAVRDQRVKDETEIDWSRFKDPALEPQGGKNLHDRWMRLLGHATKALMEQDNSIEYDHDDKLKWLLERYPVKGSYMSEAEWRRKTTGSARKRKARKTTTKTPQSKTSTSTTGKGKGGKTQLSAEFVDSSDEEDTEVEDEGEVTDDEDDDE